MNTPNIAHQSTYDNTLVNNPPTINANNSSNNTSFQLPSLKEMTEDHQQLPWMHNNPPPTSVAYMRPPHHGYSYPPQHSPRPLSYPPQPTTTGQQHPPQMTQQPPSSPQVTTSTQQQQSSPQSKPINKLSNIVPTVVSSSNNATTTTKRSKKESQKYTDTIFSEYSEHVDNAIDPDTIKFYTRNATFIEYNNGKLLLSSVKHGVTMEMPQCEEFDEMNSRIRLVDALTNREVFCSTSSSLRSKGQRVVYGQTLSLFDQCSNDSMSTELEFRFRESTTTNKRPYVLRIEIYKHNELICSFQTEPFNVVWRDPAKTSRKARTAPQATQPALESRPKKRKLESPDAPDVKQFSPVQQAPPGYYNSAQQAYPSQYHQQPPQQQQNNYYPKTAHQPQQQNFYQQPHGYNVPSQPQHQHYYQQ